ncbi:MAG: ribonuclease J [Candidatus Liptonbacteria bacterium]
MRIPSSRPSQTEYAPFKPELRPRTDLKPRPELRPHKTGGDRGGHGTGPSQGGRGAGHKERGSGHGRDTGRSHAGRGTASRIVSPINATEEKKISPVAADALRFVPLGGLEEIGRNCSFFEFGDEIVVIDVGIQFPEEETPGIDYIIPNVSYLEGKKESVRGLILTHGHYDHIHALPYLLEKLGNPMIYTAPLTKAIIEKRLTEFPNLPKPRFQTVKNGDKLKISEHFHAEFFDIGHTIPDGIGVILDTPIGKMVNFGDFRLETDVDGKPQNLENFERLGHMNIHSVFVDSTNAWREGFSVSEKVVEQNLEMLFKGAKGRIIVATFSSMLTRIGEIIKIAAKLGRKVAINGRSMKDNVQIAQTLGYLKPEKGQVIPLEEVNKYKDEKVMILTTGAQGESNAGLMRIVSGEHKLITLKRNDTVIFSSSVVPGNERSVQFLQDNIARQVDQLFNSKLLDIHSSGHAFAEDIKLVFKLVKPKFVVPIHGYYYFRKFTAKLAEQCGIPIENVILMDNGQVAEVKPNSFKVTDQTVPAYYVMVDGLGVGDVEEIVLRDRRNLAQEGMVVIIVTVDRENGRLLKNPDIISRGFIYLKENQEMLEEIRKRIRGLISRLPSTQEAEPDYVKTLIRDQISQFLYNKTKRRPMVLPVVIEI